MTNHFLDAPTVGSDSVAKLTTEELCSRVQSLEKRASALEQSQFGGHRYNNDCQCDESLPAFEKKKRFNWNTIKEVFEVIVMPVLIFIPSVINAVANLFKAINTPKKKNA